MEKKKREIELEEKKRKWAGHIKECGESGKSQVQYCREQGLSIKLFYYWKRKLQKKHEDGVRLVPVGMQVVQVSRTGIDSNTSCSYSGAIQGRDW